ncbi:MAM and LDL-receptor class A domain-containing protein 2-like 1, partial [Homarus americanus]
IDDLLTFTGHCNIWPVEAQPRNGTDFTSTTIQGGSTTTPEPLGENDCDFEDIMMPTCLWEMSEDNGTVPWTWWHGPPDTVSPGPATDHTIGTDAGHYLYVEAQWSYPPASALLYRGPVQDAQCFSFWYYMFGENTPDLIATTRAENSEINEPIFFRTGSQGDFWHPATMDLGIDAAMYSAIIKAVWEESRQGIVAVDDLRLHSGHCQHHPTDPQALHDFEENGSMFDIVSGSKIQWNTMSVEDHPDHTLGTLKGHFARADLQKYIARDWGQIISPVYQTQGNIFGCLNFYYYLSGLSGTAELSVYMQKLGNGFSADVSKELLWKQNESQGKNWVKAQLYIFEKDNFQLIFEAQVLKNNTDAVMGIDDVYTDTHECQTSVGCDFEHELCTWTNSLDDSADWLLQSPADALPGPVTDHSTNSIKGHYVIVSGYLMPDEGGSANLKSQYYSNSYSITGSCASFWYNAAFTNGSLTVSASREDSWQTLWSLRHGTDPLWHYAKVTTDQDDSFRIVITGVLDHDQNSYIALDELIFDQLFKCSYDYIVPKFADPTTLATEDIACGFETDTCKWKASEQFQVGIEDGIHSDRGGGNYLYVSINQSTHIYHVVSLQSRRLAENPHGSHDYCFHFWYYMFGISSPFLSVKQITLMNQWGNLSTTDILWNKETGIIDLWHDVRVEFYTSKGDYQLQIEVIVYPEAKGTVGFDDLEAEVGSCKTSRIDCDFEVDNCEWIGEPSSGLNWTRVLAEEGAEAMGYDHTTNTQTGHYMYPEPGKWIPEGLSGLLIGPQLTANGGDQCLSFWYSIEGQSSLAVLTIDENNTRTELWNQSGGFCYGWVLGRADVNMSKPLKLAFRADYKVQDVNDVVLDDITVVPDHCPSSSLSCDFDDSLCTWTNVLLSKQPWLVGRGFTEDPSVVSGPFEDHTTQDGLYAYVDFTTYGLPGEVSRLKSEEMPPQAVACLSFWYVKYGESSRSGVLTVKWAALQDNGDQPVALLTLDNNVNVRQWTRSVLNVTSPKERYFILFDAQRVTPDQFIAIDDVNLLPEDCAAIPTTTASPSQLVICDFEADDLCGFAQRQDDNFDWTHGTGKDNELLPNDHTTGNISGHYMYVDPTHRGIGASASLAAPAVYDLPEACVALTYFTTGKAGTLKVYLHTQEDQQAILLGNFSAPFNTWIGVRMPVLVTGVWQIELKVTVEPNSGFIGIDDYIMSPGACPDPVSCDFEDGTCLWQNVEKSKWSYGRVTDDPNQAAGYGFAPPFDHTTETPYGHYLYFYDAPDAALTAIMLSETFTSKNDSCISYWLHMFGEKVDVRKSPQQWLSFSVEGVDGSVNVVALDDLEFSIGACSDNSSVPDFRCGNGALIPQHEVCDYLVQCPDKEDEKWCADCAFSEDTCTVSQVDPHAYHMEVKRKKGPVVNQPRILTHLLQPAHHTCALHMDYKLFAPTAPGPKLNVYMEHGGSDLTTLFQAQMHLEEWQTLQLPLGRIPSSYHLVVEASSSNDPSEIIAVDELMLSNCFPPSRCDDLPDGYIWCENMVCYPSEVTCDFTDDCGDYSDEASCKEYPLRCSFEDHCLCGWVASEFFKLTQTRASGKAPFRDHTLNSGDGHIMLVDSRSPRTATITSPSILPSSQCQIRFYHTVFGAGTTLLNVRVRSSESEAILSEMVIVSHEEESFFWQRFSEAYTFNQSFYIELEGDIREWGSVGIDDISLTPECKLNFVTPSPLPPISTTKSPCEDGFFPCKYDEGHTLKCISLLQVCDFNVDCPLNDDESLCGSTTFEDNSGGWQDTSDTAYAWSRIKAGDAHYSNCTAPDFDHTNPNTGEGYYMWAPAKLADVPEATATMETPILGPPGLACTMYLWYYCKDDEPMLSVMAWTADENHEMIYGTDLSCSHNQKWREGQFFIGEQNTKITAELKSTKFSSSFTNTQYDIAVDDITFRQCSVHEPPSYGDIYCTFSQPCDLYQSHNDDMDWVPRTEHINTFLVARGGGDNRTAILQTLWRNTHNGFCLSFRYLIKGKASLEITKMDTQNETVWTRGGGMNYLDWYTQYLYLYSYPEYQISIIAHTGDLDEEIQIDDVDITEDVCPASLTCSFDEVTEVCEWDNYIKDNDTLPWNIGHGSDGLPSAPPVDHSWGTKYGHYRYIDLQVNQENQVAYLRSQEISTTTPDGDCFQFWFYLYSSETGEDVGELGVVLEGLRLHGALGYMAWDDLTVRRGACSPPGTCDFEEGLCGWRDIPDSRNNNWAWLKAEEASDGVLVDHTTGTGDGHYVSFDQSRCNVGSSCYADLVSSTIIPEDSQYCFTFYMNNLQSNPDKNSVTLEVLNPEDNTTRLIATYSNMDDNIWTPFQQPLDNLIHTFQLRLRSSMVTDLLKVGAYNALDDLDLYSGECKSHGTTLEPTATPPPDTQLTCTFEGGTLCGWLQDSTDGRDWTLSTGEIVHSKLGPEVDHTTHLSGGHFILVKSAGLISSANLLSETLRSSEDGHCLSFSYYMHGSAPPFLKMYILKAGEKPQVSDPPDWDHLREVGETWQQVHLFIPKQDYSQHVALVANTQNNNGDDGHSAVDDILLTDGSCDSLRGNKCDFETSDLCEWLPSQDNGVEWIWNSGQNLDHNNGPDFDHTFGSLSVYVKDPAVDITDVDPVWNIAGPQGDVWNLARNSLSFISNYQTAFAAVVGSDGDNSIIAIDDFIMLDTDCPAAATCSFEDGYCDWSNVRGTDEMDWEMNQGPTPTENTGPKYDHTLETVKGHYLYVEADDGMIHSSAILESPLVPAGTYCFEFYYSMYGRDIGGLAVQVQNNHSAQTLFQKFGDQGPDWKKGKTTVIEDKDFKFQVITLHGKEGDEGDIAIDDTWTSKGPCHDNPDEFVCPDDEIIPYSQVCDFIPECRDEDDEMLCGVCNFEFGLCGWIFLMDNDYIWARGRNLSDDENSWNVPDHTVGTGAGYYLYITKHSSEHSGPAVMVTETHHNAFLDCTMNFWVRERSDSNEGLHTRVAVNVLRDGQVSPVFYLIDKSNNDWQQANAVLKGLCVPYDFLCDNTNDCGDLTDEHNCEDFLPICTLEEDETCDWAQEPDDDDIDWVYGQGHTVAGRTTFLTGPPVDHTLRLSGGHYIYATSPTTYAQDERQGKVTYRAWFVSPVIRADDDSYFPCELRFHYYMYGQNIEELNVYTRTERHGDMTLSFTRKGEQGQFWDRSVVPTPSNKPFQYVIEGVTNNLGLSDIAIDDLSFTESCMETNDTLPGGNTPEPPYNPCANDEFYCNIGEDCIANYMVCDWKNDCSNGADEDNCGTCNFEYDMCSWSDASKGIFHWRRITGADFSQYSHPFKDHTSQQSDGHFIYVEGSDGTVGKTAVLVSPALSHTTGYYCEIHFWLFLENGMNAHVGLYYHNNYQNKDHLLYNLTTSEIQEKVWYEVLVSAKLVPSTDYFKLTTTPVFDQTIDWADSHSSVSIDDISFFNCNERFLDLACDFDDAGTCNWRQAQTDQQDWRKSDPSIPLPDHTSGTGHYIYINFLQNFAVKGDKARLISTVQSKPVGVRNVFTLWYYLYGGDVGIFRIIERKQNTKENDTLFEIGDSQDDRWMLFEQELDADDDYSIVLEAEWGEIGSGMLAVDDVKITSKIQNPFCDFEEDFCQWQLDDSDTAVWARGRGKQNKTGLPPVDHTDNTNMGHYAYLKEKPIPGKTGTLTSPAYHSVGVQCLRFWYHILGDNVGELSVQVADQAGSGVFTPFWSHENNTFEMWSLGMVTLPNLQKYVVRFEGTTGRNNLSVIALDDVEFLPDACPKVHECDFEYDVCDWFNTDDEDTFDWERSSGSEGGGISVDHTLNFDTGHYMVAKLQDKKKGDSAKLFGGTVPKNLRCMTFWYSMQHIKNAKLRVILLEGDGITLMELHNSTLDYLWEEITLNLNIVTDSFEVQFELLVAEDITFSEYYAVAIDDTAFTADCKIPTFPPPVTTPLPTHLPSIYDCDFEQDDNQMCGWTLGENDGLLWQRWQGQSSSSETGPKTDHTLMTDDGHYIYVGTTFKVERNATLISPPIDMGVNGACLSFWYHMHGFDIGMLQVLLQVVGTNSTTSVWQRSHEQGDDWIQAKVHLNGLQSSHMILEAIPKPYGKGDIALDDITLDFGFCNTGKLCDFESGNICQFEQSLIDDLDWELVMVSSSRVVGEVDPEEDHSQQSSLGHYLKLSGEGSAVIVTNEIHPQYCCVEFWVYLDGFFGYSSSDLYVYTLINGVKASKINITDVLGHNWNHYLLPVTSSFYYSLAFESHVRGSGYTVGLDDVQPLISCEAMEECNFESDLCMWKNSVKENQFDWSITTGNDLDSIYAPTVDITLGSPYGKFAYVDTYRDDPATGKPHAILESNVMEPMERCISFWFHIKGAGTQSLILSTKDILSGVVSDIWEYSLLLFADWEYKQFSIMKSERYTIQFEAVTSNDQGMIALDQVKVVADLCSNHSVPDCVIKCDEGATCIHEDQMCNFVQDCMNGEDENFCGYNCTFDEDSHHNTPCSWDTDRENGDILTWLPLSGQLNDSYGPPVDHTFLTPLGHYMAVIPVNGKVREEKPAVLLSPPLKNSGGYCLMTFWYVMYGRPDNTSSSFIGSLIAVYQMGDLSTELLSINGNKGDEWLHGVAYIGRVTPEFYIRFEGDRNLDIDGYMAVDDITFENCFLPTPQKTPGDCKEYQCTNLACVSMFDRCDFVDDCGDYSDEVNRVAGCNKFVGRCSFEDNTFCDWEQDDSNNWYLGSPSVQDIIPKRDHTLNSASGSFIYIDNTFDYKNTTVATILSPVIKWDDKMISPCILHFFYCIYGPAAQKLTVSSRDASNGPLNIHLVITDAVGPYWEQAEISMAPQDIIHKPLQFIITGERDSLGKQRSVIAIDDISFTESCVLSDDILPTASPSIPTTTSGACPNQFQCNDGECIPLDHVCNFMNNCIDGTDEAMCAECSFENGTCGWRDISYGSYFWTLDEPNANNRSGQVMIVEGKSGSNSKEANLISVALGPSATNCIMSFFYYKHLGEDDKTSLQLDLKSHIGNEFTVWYVLTDMNDTWHQQFVGIGEHEMGWSLRFQANHYDTNGLVMIDDVHFENCSKPNSTICKPYEYRCDNGVCVTKDKFCDFNDDCGDGTDEIPALCKNYPERCNFEDSFCNWKQEVSELEWIRKTGDMMSEDVGPDFDHTYGNETGYYLYLESGEGDQGKIGRVSSTAFYPSTTESCFFRFWYMIRADKSASLTAFVEETSWNSFGYSPSVQIFQTNGTAEYLWTRTNAPVIYTRYFKILLEAKVGEKFDGDIAIDDVSFSLDCKPTNSLPTVSPTPGPCSNGQYFCSSGECIPDSKVCDLRYDCRDNSDELSCPSICNFEVDVCGWQEAVPDKLDWIRAKADDSNFGTNTDGPLVDQTGNRDGHFLFLFKTTDKLIDEKGLAFTHFYQNTAPYCHYHYWFFNKGILGSDIILRLNSTPYEFTNLTFFTSESGIDESHWIDGEVGIGRQKYPFQLSFYKEPSDDYFGKFAIDETLFDQGCHYPDPVDGNCAINEYHCRVTKVCILAENMCDLSDDCGTGEDESTIACLGYHFLTLEDDTWIKWFSQGQNGVDDDFDWTLWSGSTPTVGTGPNFDHTTSSYEGHYLYLETAHPQHHNQKAWLVSYPIIAGPDCTFTFYSHMYGRDTGSLSILLRNESHSNLTKIWTMNSEIGNFWVKQVLTPDLLPHKVPFQLIFEGTVGDEQLGDIAIDDFVFSSDCRLDSQPTHNCTAEEYQCSDGTCLPLKNRCNFAVECPNGDNSDEEGCVSPMCTFEDGDLCNWEIKANQNKSVESTENEEMFTWKILRGMDSIDNEEQLPFKPKQDHTHGDDSSYYAFSSSSRGEYETATDLITTRAIGKTCLELNKYKCRASTCIDEDKVCDYSNDCLDTSDEIQSICDTYKFRCSFEDGLCNDWKEEIENTANWVLLQASSNVVGNLPATDHTTYTTEGHYLKFDGNTMENRTVGQIRSPVLRGSSKDCFFRMWYQYLGDQPGNITIYKRYTYYRDGLVVLSKCDTSVKNLWLRVNLPVRNGLDYSDFAVVVEGSATPENSGNMVLDDFSMSDTCELSDNQRLPGSDDLTTPTPICPDGYEACSNGKCYQPIEACNFKDDCGDGTDERDCRGQVAVLESRTFSSVNRDCTLSLWYYLASNVSEESTLTLLRKTEEDTSEILWKETASYLAGWEPNFVTISGKRDFTLHFKANHGPGATYLALDDIHFSQCAPDTDECEVNTDFNCGDGSCVPLKDVCDAKYDCLNKMDEYQCPPVKGNCNFDSETWHLECDYIQRTDDDLDWKRASSSGDPALGPQHDHTLGSNGYYLYVSNTNGELGQLAGMKVDFLYPPSEDICYLRFWYYMHSDETASNVTRSDGRITAASISGNHNSQWMEEIILINMGKYYSVIFEAETGNPIYTYIAIDDVSFTPECETGVGPPPFNNTCDPNERACKDGECIPATFFCDCYLDCLDGSDEDNCGTTCTTLMTRPTTTPGSTTTTTNPNACQDTQFPCNDNMTTCIPSLLLCDGISDCPNKADEEKCPDKTPCDDGFFYCADPFMIELPCMSNSNLCNGMAKCLTYKADESLCGYCPENYCQNNGTCSAVNGGPPVCKCTNKYTGNRCELQAPLTTTPSPTTSISPSTPSTTTPSPELGAGPIVGIVLGVLAFIILAGVITYYYIKKKRYSPTRDGSNWDDPRHQPYFGLDMPQPTEDQYPLDELNKSNTGEGTSNPTFLKDFEEPSVSNKPTSDL